MTTPTSLNNKIQNHTFKLSTKLFVQAQNEQNSFVGIIIQNQENTITLLTRNGEKKLTKLDYEFTESNFEEFDKTVLIVPEVVAKNNNSKAARAKEVYLKNKGLGRSKVIALIVKEFENEVDEKDRMGYAYAGTLYQNYYSAEKSK